MSSDMVVEILTLCDSAQFKSGKIDIVGAFDAFDCDGFPALFRKFSVAGRVRVDKEGKYETAISFLTPDGELLVKAETAFDAPHTAQHSTTFQISFDIKNLTFPIPGRYTLVLTVNNLTVFTCPFFVNRKTPIGGR